MSNRCLLFILLFCLLLFAQIYFSGYFHDDDDDDATRISRDLDGVAPSDLPYLTIHCASGRLGNQISLLAALYGVAYLNGRRPSIKRCHQEELRRYFELSFIPVVDRPAKKELGYALKSYLRPGKDNHVPKNATILVGHRYPSSYTFYQHIAPELRLRLTFRHKFIEHTQKVLRKAAKQYKQTVEKCIFVGVHVRMTDYPEYILKRNGRVIDADYFRKGMDYFRGKYGVQNPNATGTLIFVVTSDDRNWCKRNFRGLEDVFISPPVPESGFDMSLLVACNHSIISYGTFSFWSAYLKSSGETVRFDDYVRPGSQFLRVNPYSKVYPPSWIPISTTPPNYWKQFKLPLK